MVNGVAQLIGTLEHQKSALINNARFIQTQYKHLQEQIVVSRVEFDTLKSENTELKKKVGILETKLADQATDIENRFAAMEARFESLKRGVIKGEEFV